MKRLSLEYCKFILERVSFDPLLFEKEYKKAITNLTDEDISELNSWVKKNYTRYSEVTGKY